MAESAPKTVLIGPSLELGGAERQILVLADHLARVEGWPVEVWGMGKWGAAGEIGRELGLTCRTVATDWPPNRTGRAREVWRFAQVLRRAGAEVVLPYTYVPNRITGLAWRLSGARLCIWNQRDEGRHFEPGRVVRLSVRLAGTYASNSQHGADFLVHNYGAPADRVSVIHNGVRLDEPRCSPDEWRRELGVAPDVRVVGMIANLHEFKDQATLLRAWPAVLAALRERGEDAALLLGGRFDNTHDALKALAYDLELGRSVRFLGPVADVSGLLATMDLFAFSSRTEGSPNSLLEAMAAGLPVVASDIPGIREAVPPATLNWLLPASDADAMASAILRLLSDELLSRELGAANRAWVQREYSPLGMCTAMTQLIRSQL